MFTVLVLVCGVVWRAGMRGGAADGWCCFDAVVESNSAGGGRRRRKSEVRG